MNKLKSIFITCLLCFITSCREYENIMEPAIRAKLNDKNSNPIFDGEIEPPIPEFSKNNINFLGVDLNKNGIRDDIDIWINRSGINYNERMAMRQYAKAQQFWLKVCNESLINEVMKAENDSINSLWCLSYLSDHRFGKWHYLGKKIDTLTFIAATRDCAGFYKKNSTVVSLENTGESYLNCKFDIENLPQVKELRKKTVRELK